MTARILVVDDEPDLELLIVQRFRRQIRDGQFSFTFADDGVNALATLGEDPTIDMVLCDINMPRMDGLTLLGRLQERDDHLATVIVSAYGDMANIRTAMNRGAFDFVTKPIDFADLETTIGKTLRNLEITRGYQRRQQEAERARAQLARYFSPSLVDCITSATDDIDLGAQRRDITSMFTDITSFTTLVEGLEPNTIGPLLNEYLTGMTEIVFDHGGTLVKIVGDALNVLFGAPADQPDHAEHAVACALALDAYAEDFRARWRDKGVAVGTTRIGDQLRTGAGRQFRRRTVLRLHRLRRHHQHRCTAGGGEQAGRHSHLRQRQRGRADRRLPRPPGRQRDSARAQRASDGARAADGGASRRRADRRVFGRLRQGGRMRPGSLSAFAALLGRDSGDGLVSFHLKRLLTGVTGISVALE